MDINTNSATSANDATNTTTSGRALKELVNICGRMGAEYLVLHLGTNPDKQAGLRYAMSAF